MTEVNIARSTPSIIQAVFEPGVELTLKTLMSPITALVPKIQAPDELRAVLSEELHKISSDKLFNEFVLKFYVPDITSSQILSELASISAFPLITSDAARRILSKIFKGAQPDIRNYITLLTMDVPALVAAAADEYEKVSLGPDSFRTFLSEFVRSKIALPPAESGIYSVLSHFTQTDGIISTITKPCCLEIAFNTEGCFTFADIWNKIADTHSAHTVKGINLDNSFINAVKIFSYIAPQWDSLSAALSMRTGTPAASSGMTGGARLADSDVVQVFAGNYALVPSDYPQAAHVDTNIVSNFQSFNALDDAAKLRTSKFLSDNRARFNGVISQSVQLITKMLEDRLNNRFASVRDRIDSSKYRTTDAKPSRTFALSGGSNVITSAARTFLDKLHDKFVNTEINSFSDATDFISHSYIPLLSQFSNKLALEFGHAEANNLLSKYATSTNLAILGAANYLAPQAAATRIVEKIVPKVQYIEKPVMVGGANGKSATDVYIKNLVDGLAAFNAEYTNQYKALTAALNKISVIKGLNASTTLEVITLCESLSNIAIKNPKTSAKISGFNEAQNFYPQYKAYVEKTVRHLEMLKLPEFREVCDVCRNILKLLTETKFKIDKIRSDYLASPKTISEHVVIATKQLDQPCGLSDEQVQALVVAIRRVRNLAQASNTQESTIKTANIIVENYNSSLEQREKAIKEHYEWELMGVKSKYAQNNTFTADLQNYHRVEVERIEKIRACMLYLNKTFDSALLKERLEQIKHINLSEEQIKNIESAFSHYKNAQSEPLLKKALVKLNRVMKEHNPAIIWRLLKKLKKVVIATRFIDFIKQLCMELGLFAKDFNWNEFSENMTQLIALSAIELAEATHKNANGVGYSIDMIMKEVVMQALLNGKPFGAVNKAYDVLLNNEAFKKHMTKFSFSLEDIAKIYDEMDANSPVQVTNAVNTTASGAQKEIIASGAVIPGDIAAKPGDHVAGNLAPKTDATFLKHDDKGGKIYAISITQGKPNEFYFVEAAFKALYADVLTVFNKYFAVRYEGKLDLPLNLTAMIGGSKEDKVNGGSLFDHAVFPSSDESDVIPEAVPFYIPAINVIVQYIHNFISKDTGAPAVAGNEYATRMEIGKFSVLYPFFKLFAKQEDQNAPVVSDIKYLTNEQLKQLLIPLNSIWKRTKEGAPAVQLSQAIDILFAELNACIIFTDKMTLEMMKATNSLSRASIDIISEKAATVAKSIADLLKKDADSFANGTEEQYNQEYERKLNAAYNAVKNQSQVQALAILKEHLTPQEESVDNLHEYFKFMELVITPMLIAAKAYSNIFGLYSNWTSTLNGVDLDKIDFSEYNFTHVIIKEDGNRDTNPVSVWDLIQRVRRGEVEYKIVFMDAPIVYTYNRLVLQESFNTLLNTHVWIEPKFWIVMDENTYPKERVIQFSGSRVNVCTTINYLKQIYPRVHANNVYDFYQQTITDFQSDFEHFVHNFVSYPGIPRAVLNKVNTVAETIKNTNLEEMTKDTIKTNLEAIKVQKSSSFIPPPPPRTESYLPPLQNIDYVEELRITNSPETDLNTADEKHPISIKNVRIGDTALFIESRSCKRDTIVQCDFEWIDWVVCTLAKCDIINYCLPYRLLTMLQSRPILVPFLMQPGVNKKAYEMRYNRNAGGRYPCILTQNIVARTLSDRNKPYIDYYQMNPNWIAALITTIPYVINVLQAYDDSMESSVQVNGVYTHAQLTQIIDTLTAFYDEILVVAPHVEFMCDGQVIPRELASKTVPKSIEDIKVHPFAQLAKFVSEVDLYKGDMTEVLKLEWANAYFFNHLQRIRFPDSGRDRMEFIKRFCADKIHNGGMSGYFETTVQILARLAWSSAIAKAAVVAEPDTDRFNLLRDTILKVYNIMADVDQGITTQFIKNIVNYTYNQPASNNMIGGAMIAANETLIDNEWNEIIKVLTYGLYNTEIKDHELDNKDKRITRLINIMDTQNNRTYYTADVHRVLMETLFRPINEPEPPYPALSGGASAVVSGDGSDAKKFVEMYTQELKELAGFFNDYALVKKYILGCPVNANEFKAAGDEAWNAAELNFVKCNTVQQTLKATQKFVKEQLLNGVIEEITKTKTAVVVVLSSVIIAFTAHNIDIMNLALGEGTTTNDIVSTTTNNRALCADEQNLDKSAIFKRLKKSSGGNHDSTVAITHNNHTAGNAADFGATDALNALSNKLLGLHLKKDKIHLEARTTDTAIDITNRIPRIENFTDDLTDVIKTVSGKLVLGLVCRSVHSNKFYVDISAINSMFGNNKKVDAVKFGIKFTGGATYSFGTETTKVINLIAGSLARTVRNRAVYIDSEIDMDKTGVKIAGYDGTHANSITIPNNDMRLSWRQMYKGKVSKENMDHFETIGITDQVTSAMIIASNRFKVEPIESEMVHGMTIVCANDTAAGNPIAVTIVANKVNGTGNIIKQETQGDSDIPWNRSLLYSSIKPKTHAIRISDKMFKIAACDMAVQEYLFNPQKDIRIVSYRGTNTEVVPATFYNKLVKDNINFTSMAHTSDAVLLTSSHRALFMQTVQSSSATTTAAYRAAFTFVNGFGTLDKLIPDGLSELVQKLIGDRMNIANDPYKSINEAANENNTGITFRGGAFIHEQRALIDKNYNKVLFEAYGDIFSGDKPPKADTDGFDLFKNMFGERMINGGIRNGSEAITAATIRYFRKYNVSYGSMFNNTMMPNILYGAAVFDRVVASLKDIIKKDGDMPVQQKFVSTYISDINFEDVLDNTKLDASKADHATAPAEGKSFNNWSRDPTKITPNNIYTSPSICGQLVKTFLDFTTPGLEGNAEAKTTIKPEQNSLSLLIQSPVGKFVRLNDALSTYAYMFYEFLLHTSFYSETLEREVTYANIPVREPFQIV